MSNPLTWEAEALLNAANFIVCTALFWACVCRLASMSHVSAGKGTRAAYSILTMAVLGAGTSPIWSGQTVDIAQFLLAVSYLAVMVANRKAWPGILQLVREGRHTRHNQRHMEEVL